MIAGFHPRFRLSAFPGPNPEGRLRPFSLSARRSNRIARRFFLGIALAAALSAAASSAFAKGVIAWGNNTDGQINVPPGLDATAVSGGASHSMALKTDGTVVAWGYNGYGATSVPAGLTGVTAISAGANHSLALKTNGTVVGWGYDFYGAASVPPGLSGVKAIAAGGYHSLALKTDGTVVAWGYNGYGATSIPAGLTNVVAIGAGAYHSMALKGDGTVVAWGYDFYGVATVPTGLKNVVSIAAGNYHSLALKSDGTIVGWGYNGNGAVTIPAAAKPVVSIAAGAYHSVALKGDGTVLAWGYDGSGVGSVPPGLTKIAAVNAGSYHNLVLFTLPEPPVAVAGSDRHVTEGAFVTLDGSLSRDPNVPARALVSPLWTQTAGPAVQLSNSNTLVANFVAPVVSPAGAVLTFSFSISNGFATKSATVNINVDNINIAPTANAGAAQTVNENSLVTLHGSGSDADGDALTLRWIQVGGPLVMLDGADTAAPSFTAPPVSSAQGSMELAFRLSVNDGFVSSGPSDVTIRVLNTNDAPIANAGGDKSANETSSVSLVGSGSIDPNGDALSYSWTQIGGTPLVGLTGADTAIASFIAPDVAFGGTTLTFKLTVNDGELSDSNVVNIRINNVNHVPLADAGLDQTAPEGAFITLNAADSADLDGDALTFAWNQTEGPLVELINALTANPSFAAPDVGANGAKLAFQVTVDDGYGGVTSDEVRVNVQYVNRAPVANAGNDQTPNEGSLVTLDGTGSDPDENALAFSWTQVGGPLVELSDMYAQNPTFIAPAVTRAEDDLVFQLTVNDPYGGTAVDDVKVHVANINHAPVAQAPANVSVGENEIVNLVGSAIDPDAEEQGQLACAWQQIAGPQVVLVGTGPNVSFTAPQLSAAGDPNAKVTLTFRLSVSDPDEAICTDDVDVVVANMDHSPLANAGGNLTTNEGSSVTLERFGEQRSRQRSAQLRVGANRRSRGHPERRGYRLSLFHRSVRLRGRRNPQVRADCRRRFRRNLDGYRLRDGQQCQ
jgi:hypothetical protein